MKNDFDVQVGELLLKAGLLSGFRECEDGSIVPHWSEMGEAHSYMWRMYFVIFSLGDEGNLGLLLQVLRGREAIPEMWRDDLTQSIIRSMQLLMRAVPELMEGGGRYAKVFLELSVRYAPRGEDDWWDDFFRHGDEW